MLLHIDTDMGVDDGLALVLASRLSDVRIAAVSTVFGNVDLRTATRNAALFQHLLEAGWPIFVGADSPSRGDRRNASHIHGEDGLGQTTLNPDIAALVHAASQKRPPSLAALPRSAEPITILGIGPATNICAIVERYGREHVAAIVLMSGVFFDQGNITDTVEFNAGCDPHALGSVLDLGLPTTIVPLDVCRKVQLMRETVRGYGTRSPLLRVLVHSHMHYMDQYQKWESIDGCFPHDAITLLAAVYAERFWRLRGRVSVAEDGTTRFTFNERSNVQIVTGGELRFVREGLRTLLFPPVSLPE